MLFELQGQTHRVKFMHFNPYDPNIGIEHAGEMFGTQATLFSALPATEETPPDQAWKELAVGWSFLHPNDMRRYNRETGRKISLSRALLTAFPGEGNKATRKAVWEAYLNRPRHTPVQTEPTPPSDQS